MEVMVMARKVRIRKRDRPVMKAQGDSTTCMKRSSSAGGTWPVTWPRSGVLSFMTDQQWGVKTLLNMAGEGVEGERGGMEREEEGDEEGKGKGGIEKRREGKRRGRRRRRRKREGGRRRGKARGGGGQQQRVGRWRE